MRIFLTGATGFIGSAFLNSALRAGHELGALIRPGATRPLAVKGRKEIQWIHGTLAELPLAQITQFAPDVCVHTAWISTPGVYLESPENYRFLDWSFELVKRLSEIGTGRFVVLGTCIEYDMQGEILSETTSRINPTTVYARCKNQLRIKLEDWLVPEKSSLCWARVFYPYGIGEHPARLCSSLIKNILAGQPTILKTPNSVKDYVYIDDLADAILAVVENRTSGPINLGTGIGFSVGSIAQTIAKTLKRPDMVGIPSDKPADAFDQVIADSSKLRSLGWLPKIDIDEGTSRLINHLAA